MKKIVISALAIAAMVSCSKTELETRVDTSNAIVFGSSIETDTKRTDASTAFDNDEKINVYGYRMDSPAPTADFTANLFLTKTLFTYNGTQFVSADANALWKLNKAHNFYAYFPTTLTVTNFITGTTAPLEVTAITGIDAANDVMIAKLETPLYDGTQSGATLKFRHILSKVRFKIKKEFAGDPNVELTGVEFRMKNSEGSVNLMTGEVSNRGGIIRLSKDLTATPLAINSTTAVDVPGNWMVLPADEIRDMIFTINGSPMRLINTNATIATLPGKITAVTITVKVIDNSLTFTSEIEAWGEDNRNGEDMVPELPGPAITYGKGIYPRKLDNVTSITQSHNDLYGAGTTTNGAYGGAEQPYCKFEIANADLEWDDNGTPKTDIPWAIAQGTTPGGLCTEVMGKGWRLPRQTELRTMMNNIIALNAAGDRFVAFESGASWWSASENSTSNAYYSNALAGNGHDIKSKGMKVRCIKELPAPPPPSAPPVLEYSKPPYGQVGAVLKGFTYVSYNGRYGSGTNNGLYRADATAAYAGDRAFYKFEVAAEDVYSGGANNKNWADLQGTASNHLDNICVTTHGAGWRMPRLSEMRLMYENRAALNIHFGANYAIAGSYWSATEGSASTAWSINFVDGTASNGNKTLTNYGVRCVKELAAPVLEPVIVEYGKPPYNQVGTLLKGYTPISYNVLHGAGTTTNGAYRTNADAAYLNEQPYVKFEVAIKDAYNGADQNKGWAALQGTASDRSDNICEKTHGEGWRLPRLSEIRLIYENRVALNSIVGFDAIAGSYWSATEVSGSNALSINFGDGTTPSGDKTLTTVSVRCIKEIYVPIGPVLEYGVVPYDKKGPVTTSTRTSYNGKWGVGASNGAYQTEASTAYTNEPPYYKFEVAQTDAYVTGDGKNWTVLQGTKPDRSDNICEMTHGEGWRIPRVSEMRLIWDNKFALNASGNGFTAMTGSYYWSATEGSSTNAWYISFSYGTSTNAGKGNSLNVRCIKELP